MTTREFLRKIAKPGVGVKRWFALIMVGGFVIFVGVLALDFTWNHQLASFFDDVFKRIYDNYNLPIWFLPFLGWMIVTLGIGIAVGSAFQAILIIMRIVLTASPRTTKQTHGSKIVVLGGGSGTHSVLMALKSLGASVTAVVTVADSGGSTGKLREEFSILAPGDIRRCIVALSEQPLLDKIMQYRFGGKGTLSGHSLGNLIITALTDTEGDFTEAVYRMSKLVGAKGAVIPFTIDDVSLCARYEDGSVVSGEANIPKIRKPIKNVFFNPPYAKPFVRVLEAVSEADFIIVGPGSLYTSIMPTLLLTPIIDTIMRSDAKKIYIANIMTEPGETDDYTVTEHIKAIKRHTNVDLFDILIVNNGKLSDEEMSDYQKKGASQITLELGEEDLLPTVISTELITVEEGLVRHSIPKLSRVLSGVIKGRRGLHA